MIVNSSISPSNSADQVRGDEHRAAAGIAFLIGADDRLDELAPDDRIEAGRRLVEHEQVRLGADRGDERELRALPLRQVARLLRGSSRNCVEQGLLGLAFQRGRKDAK